MNTAESPIEDNDVSAYDWSLSNDGITCRYMVNVKIAKTRTIKRYPLITVILAIIIALGGLGWLRQALSAVPLSVSEGSSLLSRTEIQSIIQQARESWIEGNAEAFAALFTENGEFLVPGNRWVGREAIRQVAADFAASSSNVAVEIRELIVEGNHAAVEWYWEDTENASGRRNRADDAIVIDFVDGKISRWREYIDTQTPINTPIS